MSLGKPEGIWLVSGFRRISKNCVWPPLRQAMYRSHDAVSTLTVFLIGLRQLIPCVVCVSASCKAAQQGSECQTVGLGKPEVCGKPSVCFAARYRVARIGPDYSQVEAECKRISGGVFGAGGTTFRVYLGWLVNFLAAGVYGDERMGGTSGCGPEGMCEKWASGGRAARRAGSHHHSFRTCRRITGLAVLFVEKPA